MIGFVSVLVCVFLMTSASQGAFPPPSWKKGDEKAIFGHTFDEEYWTNPAINVTSPFGDTITFSASYVNSHRVQAFLMALNMVENSGGKGTFPFQFFGMHYYTPQNREVFIGAVLAFLMVFNDTYNGTGPGQNGLPDPGNEDVLYVIPFGVGAKINETYPPVANVIAVQKLGEGHFKFGMQYKNLYAMAVPNWVSLWLKTGWIAKFSELTVTYEITIDNKTGEVKAETWYTIGEITELYFFFLGIPIPQNPHKLSPTLGISAVHFVTVFTSKYQTPTNATGNTINAGITKPTNDINIRIGDDSERAMQIGFRGTFDLIDENSSTTIKKDQPAINAIVGAKVVDLLLLAWQLGFSAGAMSIFGYALSDYAQNKYSGPKDLYDHGLKWENKDGFYAQPLWYAVSFPGWNGYRVVHDPVYTAYANMNEPAGAGKVSPAVVVGIILVAAVAIVGVIFIAKRKKPGE